MQLRTSGRNGRGSAKGVEGGYRRGRSARGGGMGWEGAGQAVVDLAVALHVVEGEAERSLALARTKSVPPRRPWARGRRAWAWAWGAAPR